MKTLKILSLLVVLTLIGCSIEEETNTVDQSELLVSLEEIQEIYKTLEAETNDQDRSFLNQVCNDPPIVQLEIAWVSPFITDAQKETVRRYFENNWGKHPITGINPDGIHEQWIFNTNNANSSLIEDDCVNGNSIRDAVDGNNDVEVPD